VANGLARHVAARRECGWWRWSGRIGTGRASPTPIDAVSAAHAVAGYAWQGVCCALDRAREGVGDLGRGDAASWAVGVALPGQVAVVGDARRSSGGAGRVGDLDLGVCLVEVGVFVEQLQGDLHSVVGQCSSDGALEGDARLACWRGAVPAGAGAEEVEDDAGDLIRVGVAAVV